MDMHCECTLTAKEQTRWFDKHRYLKLIVLNWHSLIKRKLMFEDALGGGGPPLRVDSFGNEAIKGLSNIDAWGWHGAIAFGSEAIKGLKNVDAWSLLGPFPFCQLRLVAMQSKVGEYQRLKLTGGPPLCVNLFGNEAIKGSLNIDAWGWQGALPCQLHW